MSKTRRPGSRGGVSGHEPEARIRERAERAWELSAGGRTQREIAAELGVTQAAVCKILQRANDQASAALREDGERHRARLLAAEGHLYREAMKAYERSQEQQTRQRHREIESAEGTNGRRIREAEAINRDGDPRFLDQAGRSLERQSRLLGLHRQGRPGRARADHDAGAARQRLASRLARLAAASGAGPVAGQSE